MIRNTARFTLLRKPKPSVFPIILILFMLGSTQPVFPIETATFPRHPSLSPDGEQVAFSYAGDIWTVSSEGGNACRLTVHPAYEHSPKWSPDGAWIAFSANRHGADDIYIIPSAGGQSKRLTWFDTDDKVCCWTPDSRRVIFTGCRDDRYPDYNVVYSVSIDGGTPRVLMDTPARYVDMSPDGSSLLYVYGGVSWCRKHYLGSSAGQVWMVDLKTMVHMPITELPSGETGEAYKLPSYTFPLWGKVGEVYIVSDKEGTFNLYRLEHAGAWTRLTDFSEDGVRFPSIATEDNTIAFEQRTDIFIQPAGCPPEKLEIISPLDLPSFEPDQIRYSNRADQVEFASDGRSMVFGVRGEVFAGRIVEDEFSEARGRANPLSGNHWAREGDFTLSPGGDSLVFVSDRTGNRDLYLVFSDDQDNTGLADARQLKLVQLTDDPADEHTPHWSPDGELIAFVRGKGDLIIHNVDNGKEFQLLKSWSLQQYAWSPDSKWIAYAREDNNYNSDVFIIPIEGGASVNVSRHPDEDEYPVWSADGRKLAFRSKRRENNWDIYFAFLRLEDHYKYPADWAEETYLGKAPVDKDEEKKKKEDKEQLTVQIDTTEIYRRLRNVTRLVGEEGLFDISPDGEKFAYKADHEGKQDIYISDWNGKNLERLTNGDQNPHWIRFSPDGKDVRYLTGNGSVKSIKVSGGKTQDYPFEAYVTVDYQAERMQKFREVWRGLNDRFYDSNFHGYDWRALQDKYAALVPKASCERDFGDIVNMMLGEINASHMGYNSPHPNNRHSTGMLGLDFDPADTGPGLLITHVLEWGPCVRGEDRVESGDRLLQVNGVDISPVTNIHALLDEQVSQKVELTIKKGKKEKCIFVRPMGHYGIGHLRYEEWVQARRFVVDSLSSGRIGYLHLRGMGDPSLARFEAQLFSMGEGKDGLIVDVRNNSGGWTTDYLLAMLQVKRHAVTYPRDGGPGYPQGRLPLYSWTKPITALCNHNSFSNAEIFSHAIKTLKRGTLVGEPTPGGVISTDWRGLMDGSGYRVPLRGWFVGEDPERSAPRCMEGNGAVPDIIIPLRPGEITASEDRQLEAAVRELMTRIDGKSD